MTEHSRVGSLIVLVLAVRGAARRYRRRSSASCRATALGRCRRRRATGSSTTCRSTRPSRSRRRDSTRARGVVLDRLEAAAERGNWRDLRRRDASRVRHALARPRRPATRACSSSMPSGTRNRAGGRSSTSRGRRRSSTPTRPVGRSFSSARCGAHGTARSGRRRPGRSCAGTRTSSASRGRSAA